MPKKTAIKLSEQHYTNDPFVIATQKGLTVIREPLGDALGYYNSYKRIKFIHINEDIGEEMSRFVCAHELGHAIMHPDANTPFLKKNTYFSIDRIEVEANTFAVELLLPDEALYNFEDSHLSLQEIAALHGIPNEVAHLKKVDSHGLKDRVNF